MANNKESKPQESRKQKPVIINASFEEMLKTAAKHAENKTKKKVASRK